MIDRVPAVAMCLGSRRVFGNNFFWFKLCIQAVKTRASRDNKSQSNHYGHAAGDMLYALCFGKVLRSTTIRSAIGNFRDTIGGSHWKIALHIWSRLRSKSSVFCCLFGQTTEKVSHQGTKILNFNFGHVIKKILVMWQEFINHTSQYL